MQATSDEALIGRIATGDKVAMQVLFARHHVRVYRFVLRLVRDQTKAEDLISEVFLDVWRQAGKFEARSAVSTWLLAIARYKALSARRLRRSGAGRTRNWTKRRPQPSRIRETTRKRLWRRRTRAKSCASA